MNQKPSESPQRRYDATVILVTPAVTAEQLEHATALAKVIVLIAYATGTTPERLNPVIQARVNAGIPVFLVSNNPGDDHGILFPRRYATQVNALEAGAIPIEKVNVNHMENILAAIQDELDAGNTGAKLGEAVRVKFAYGPDEERPVAEWDTPEGLADLAARREQLWRRLSAYHPETP